MNFCAKIRSLIIILLLVNTDVLNAGLLDRESLKGAGIIVYDTSGVSDDFVEKFEISASQWEKQTGGRLLFFKKPSNSDFSTVPSSILKLKVNNVTNKNICSANQAHLTCSASNGSGLFKHEIGHAIGLKHEHQRSDRDRHIKLSSKYKEISIVPSYNFNIRTQDKYVSIGDYDFVSIMHYSNRYSSELDEWLFQELNSNEKNKKVLGYFNKISSDDKDSILQAYKFVKDYKPVVNKPIERNIKSSSQGTIAFVNHSKRDIYVELARGTIREAFSLPPNSATVRKDIFESVYTIYTNKGQNRKVIGYFKFDRRPLEKSYRDKFKKFVYEPRVIINQDLVDAFFNQSIEIENRTKNSLYIYKKDKNGNLRYLRFLSGTFGNKKISVDAPIGESIVIKQNVCDPIVLEEKGICRRVYLNIREDLVTARLNKIVIDNDSSNDPTETNSEYEKTSTGKMKPDKPKTNSRNEKPDTKNTSRLTVKPSTDRQRSNSKVAVLQKIKSHSDLQKNIDYSKKVKLILNNQSSSKLWLAQGYTINGEKRYRKLRLVNSGSKFSYDFYPGKSAYLFKEGRNEPIGLYNIGNAQEQIATVNDVLLRTRTRNR